MDSDELSVTSEQITNNKIKMKPSKTQLILACIPLFWLNLTKVTFSQSLANDQSCNNISSDGFQAQRQILEAETIIRANTPSQTKMTIPSLWWAVEQFDPLDGKLVTNWQAYQTQKAINLIVDNRFWRNLDYIDKYSFVNKFGTVAREYHYNLNIISQQQDCLATYTCNQNENCDINFNQF